MTSATYPVPDLTNCDCFTFVVVTFHTPTEGGYPNESCMVTHIAPEAISISTFNITGFNTGDNIFGRQFSSLLYLLKRGVQSSY